MTSTPPVTVAPGVRDALEQCYDSALRALDHHGPAHALAGLTKGLQVLRSSVPESDWRLIAASRDHPVLERLHEDPYTAQAFTKPRGYAGDAHTLDFVYGFRSPDEAPTPAGRSLCQVSSNVPIAGAVRARCRFIAAAISQLLAGMPSATVLSIACGHMRELHAVAGSAGRQAHFIGIDQDPATIAALASLHPYLDVTATAMPVRSLMSGRAEVPHADLIYASGLYDYLPEDIAVRLTDRLINALNPGGVLLIPNLTPSNDEVGFMEAVMDWWMVYRTLDDMSRLVTTDHWSRDDLTVTTFFIAEGRVSCLRVERSAAPRSQETS